VIAINIKLKTTILTFVLLLTMLLLFTSLVGAQTATSTPTPTTTSTPTPTTTQTTTLTATPETAETLPDAGISYPTIFGIAAAIILITLSVALIL